MPPRRVSSLIMRFVRLAFGALLAFACAGPEQRDTCERPFLVDCDRTPPAPCADGAKQSCACADEEIAGDAPFSGTTACNPVTGHFDRACVCPESGAGAAGGGSGAGAAGGESAEDSTRE